MLTRSQAAGAVAHYLQIMWPDEQQSDDPLLIISKLTIEREWGWVFRCDYYKRLVLPNGIVEKSDIKPLLLVVNKTSGEVVHSSRAYSLEEVIGKYDLQHKIISTDAVS